MLKPCSKFSPGFIPSFRNCSLVNPSFGQKSLKYFSTRLIGNMSFPAGTGVCVVNTVFDDAMSFATSNDTCCSFIVFFINSRFKNAECPSFIWYMVGLSPSLLNKLTPPIPSIISCLILISWSPPYNLAVVSLSSGLFRSMSESIRYSFILPTFTSHTFMYILLFGNLMYTIKSFPSMSFTGFIGRLYKSMSLYSGLCIPCASITWLKYPFLYNSPTATNGIPISLADFKWSPDNIPNPPEYIAIVWSSPYSAEKYAIKSFLLSGYFCVNHVFLLFMYPS